MSSERGSSKDVKFVIYQVLYIFVVCVIALKEQVSTFPRLSKRKTWSRNNMQTH